MTRREPLRASGRGCQRGERSAAIDADAVNEIRVEPPVRDGGYAVEPSRPGIGVVVREDRLAKFPYRPHTIRGWFREDGSVAH